MFFSSNILCKYGIKVYLHTAFSFGLTVTLCFSPPTPFTFLYQVLPAFPASDRLAYKKLFFKSTLFSSKNTNNIKFRDTMCKFNNYHQCKWRHSNSQICNKLYMQTLHICCGVSDKYMSYAFALPWKLILKKIQNYLKLWILKINCFYLVLTF